MHELFRASGSSAGVGNPWSRAVAETSKRGWVSPKLAARAAGPDQGTCSLLAELVFADVPMRSKGPLTHPPLALFLVLPVPEDLECHFD